MRILCLFLVVSCLFHVHGSVSAQEFTIASYNLQNLFDTEATPGHQDYTYLPLGHPQKKGCAKEKNSYYRRRCKKTDWTEKKLKRRQSHLIKVLKEIPSFDLLALVEVETLALAKKIGKSFGLEEGVATTGSDRRGIQSALLFNPKKWELVGKREWPLSFVTRNLLEVKLKNRQSNKEIVVFVNHWPSQGSPTEKRTEVALLLRKRLEEAKGKAAIAVGDFNTIPFENPHPIHRHLLSLSALKEFPFKSGTYFYAPEMSWNRLDRIFYQNIKIHGGAVVKPPFATTVFEYKDKNRKFFGSRVIGVPKKADVMKKKKVGYSDHFPIYLSGSFE